MAAPRQISCLLLSRIFLLKKAACNPLLAQNHVSVSSCIRQRHLSPSKLVISSSRRDILRKTFCTADDDTEKTATENQPSSSATRSAAASSSSSTSASTTIKNVKAKSSVNTEDSRQGRDQNPARPVNNGNVNHPDPSDVSGTENHALSRNRPPAWRGQEGDIKIRADSLFDLSSDLKTTVNLEQQQIQNKDFYRRRMESEWRSGPSAQAFRGYQEYDSGPGQFVDAPPIVTENRKPIKEPAFYYAFAGLCCCSLLMGLAVFRSKEKEKDTIQVLIAKSWVANREGNLAEAEELLHKALNMAQDEKNQDAITFIYDQLANLAMKHGRLTKADGLFKETLKRMISSGTAQDDSAVIEISLKLARMYDRMRRYEEAEQGFRWCITTTEKRIAQPNDKEAARNLQSLLGMCLDCFGRYLAAHGRLQEAKETYKRALDICEKELMIDGVPHPQTVILLNDLGTVYDLGGSYDSAIEYIQRAVDLAEQRSPSDLPTVLCNLASVKMHAERFEEARVHYDRALHLAERQGDDTAILEIKNSIAQMETNQFLKAQNSKQEKTGKEGRK